MRDSKKLLKEKGIISAAEKIFASVGFKNAKMDDIAESAGITKVTLYSYFQSKENLYLAIAHKALQLLNEKYYQIIDENKNSSGLDSALDLMEYFMLFCEKNYLYSEALLDYFSMIRSSADDSKTARLTDATKESIYFMRLQDIHNLPFKLIIKEILRGQEDGSIKKDIDPMLHTLFGWTTIVGYVKVLAAGGGNSLQLFHVDLQDLKKYNLDLARRLLSN